MKRSIIIIFFILMMLSFEIIDAADQDSGLSRLNDAKWFVVGVFPNEPSKGPFQVCGGFNYDYLAAIGGENNAEFIKTTKIDGREVIEVQAKAGSVDFLNLFPNASYCVAYAYTEFNSNLEQQVVLKLGSDDGIKVWCNGNLIFVHHIHRSAIPNEDGVLLKLKQGTNKLLVKVEQGTGPWGFMTAIRTLQEEEQDCVGVINKEYRIITANTSYSENNAVEYTVNAIPAMNIPDKVQVLGYDSDNYLIFNEPVKITELGNLKFPQNAALKVTGSINPSIVIPDRVRVTAYDLNNHKITEQPTRIGELTGIQLPEKFKGLVTLKIINDKEPEIPQNQGTDIFVGEPKDLERIAENTISLGRKLSEDIKTPDKGEDLKATLSFLTDRLERNLQMDLQFPECNSLIRNIHDICSQLQKGAWQPGNLRGVRRWAYRSSIDDSIQPYTTYLPESYNPKKTYNLLVDLHGWGEDDFKFTKLLGDLHPQDFIIVGPYGRGNMGYLISGEQDVLDVIDRIEQTYHIDPECVYLVGWSLGGFGTWKFGTTMADRFAAIAPFCGFNLTLDGLSNLGNLPTLIVHGDADSTMPIQFDADAASYLRRLGYPVRFEVLPGVDHDAWTGWAKFKGGNSLFDYYRQFRRNPWPEEVRWKAYYLRWGKAYWVNILGLKYPVIPGSISQLAGSVDAKVIDSHNIEVKTEDVTSFSLDLRHPSLAQNGRINVKIDSEWISVDAGRTKIIFDKKKRWILGKPSPNGVTVHCGGGLSDLFYDPVTICYGTKVAASSQALKNAAQNFADWSLLIPGEFPLGSNVHFRVKADTEITEAELKSRNIILFGDDTQNRLTARIANQLPVRISGKDLDIDGQKFSKSGMVLTYPNPLSREHLIGVVTFPFDDSDTMLKTSTLLRGLVLSVLPDIMTYVSLDNGPEKVLNFDRNWRLKTKN